MQTELVETLPGSPEEIIDRDFLRRVITTLKIKEQGKREPFVFEYIQQPFGGHFSLRPKRMAREVGKSFAKGCYTIGVYDRARFARELAERLNASDVQNVCSYNPRKEES